MERAVGKGETVIFGVEDDQRTAGSKFGFVASLDAIGMRGDFEALRSKEFNLGVMSDDFFVTEFRIFPYLVKLLVCLLEMRCY
jgi:hypothetical protein